MSAYFACCCSIIFGTFFGWYFNNEINKQINDENQINLQLVDKKLSSIQNAEE